MRIWKIIIKFFHFLGGISPNGILGFWTKGNEALGSIKRTEFCKFEQLKRFPTLKVFADGDGYFGIWGKESSPLYKRNSLAQKRTYKKISAGERPQAARLLRSWVRIPPGAWIFVCCECRVLSGRGLCDELVNRLEESYRLCCVVVYDLETSRVGAP